MNIFKELALNDDNNVIISPLSIYQALSLTSNGARSSTLQEMLDTLDSSSIESLNRRNIEIIKAISAQKDLFIANAVFAAQSPIETFIQIAKMYKAEVSRLKRASQVNGWCAKNTNNKIKRSWQTILLRWLLRIFLYGWAVTVIFPFVWMPLLLLIPSMCENTVALKK